MLYRAGYGRKPSQERILKIKVPHGLVASLLSRCACKHGGGGSKGRVQWDPARDLMAPEPNGRSPQKMLRERAIQVGLSQELSEEYVAGISEMRDVTELARCVGDAHARAGRSYRDNGHDGSSHGTQRQCGGALCRLASSRAAMEHLAPELPCERPYVPACDSETLARLCISSDGSGACHEAMRHPA